MGDQPRMKCWAVTGPTGAGKSLLTRLLAERGAHIIDADRVGHTVLEQPEVRDGVAQAFGSRFLRDGQVDRPSVGKLVFAEPEALARLNAIVHPPLASQLRTLVADLAAQGRTSLAVIEAAVYFLLPSVGPVDLTVSVVAPAEVRQRRLEAMGLTGEQAARRIAAQVPMSDLWTQADLVYENIGTDQDLARFADELMSERT